MAAATPIAMPVAASAATQPSRRAGDIEAGSIKGQRAESATASPAARAMRAGTGALPSPGNGTNTSAPLTRASTSAKPYTAASGSATLVGITGKIPQQSHGVTDASFEHPGQQQQQSQQKRHQARNGGEGRILHGSGDLHQTDNDAGRKADRQQRPAQPERG